MTRLFCLITLLCISSAIVAQEHSLETDIVRDHMLAPVWVNGEGPFTFLVDSCIRMPALDVSVVSRLGLQRESLESNGVTVPSVQSVLDFAGLPAHQIPATIIDCGGLFAMLGREVHGLLPLYLPGYEVELDFRNHRIIWRSMENSLLQPDDPEAVRMRVDTDGAPLVQVMLNGRSMRPFRVDTAFTEMLGLPEKGLNTLTGEKADRLNLSAANDTHTTYFRLPRMQLGPARWDQPMGVILPPESKPCLGARALKAFRVVMNYEAGLIRFEAASMTVNAPSLTGYGLIPTKLDRGLWVVAVLADSPAARAGIVGGSRIVRINGEAADMLSYEALYLHLHAMPGRELKITLEATPPKPHVLVAEKLWK